jgi:hypothetical protein
VNRAELGALRDAIDTIMELAGFRAQPDRAMAANGRRKFQRRRSRQAVSLSF